MGVLVLHWSLPFCSVLTSFTLLFVPCSPNQNEGTHVKRIKNSATKCIVAILGPPDFLLHKMRDPVFRFSYSIVPFSTFTSPRIYVFDKNGKLKWQWKLWGFIATLHKKYHFLNPHHEYSISRDAHSAVHNLI